MIPSPRSRCEVERGDRLPTENCETGSAATAANSRGLALDVDEIELSAIARAPLSPE